MQFLKMHLLPYQALPTQKESLKEAEHGNTELDADGF